MGVNSGVYKNPFQNAITYQNKICSLKITNLIYKCACPPHWSDDMLPTTIIQTPVSRTDHFEIQIFPMVNCCIVQKQEVNNTQTSGHYLLNFHLQQLVAQSVVNR